MSYFMTFRVNVGFEEGGRGLWNDVRKYFSDWTAGLVDQSKRCSNTRCCLMNWQNPVHRITVREAYSTIRYRGAHRTINYIARNQHYGANAWIGAHCAGIVRLKNLVESVFPVCILSEPYFHSSFMTYNISSWQDSLVLSWRWAWTFL